LFIVFDTRRIQFASRVLQAEKTLLELKSATPHKIKVLHVAICLADISIEMLS